MDTRSKILSSHEAHKRLNGQPVCWVSGYFDPLLAWHVRLLANSGAPGHALVVEVMDPPKPLLSQKARAELVAGLAMVDYVAVSTDRSAPVAGAPMEDAEVTGGFVRHVLERHSG